MLTMPYMSQMAGDVMLYGLGAGAMPTASSVVGDIMQLRVTLKLKARGSAMIFALLISKYYLQKQFIFTTCMTVDKPNVCQRSLRALVIIMSAFNRLFKNIPDNWAELVLITHDVEKKDIDAALKRLVSFLKWEGSTMFYAS